VPLLGLDCDVALAVLLADGAVVAVVADAVHLLEGELLLLVLVRDQSHHDVVVLYQHDLYVEVEPPLPRQRLAVEQLVGRAVQLLHLRPTHAELAEVLGSLVHPQTHLLPVVLQLFRLLGLARLLDGRVLLGELGLELVVLGLGLVAEQVVETALEVADAVGQLEAVALALLHEVGQLSHPLREIRNGLLLLEQLCLSQRALLLLPGQSALQLQDVLPESPLSSQLHLLQRQLELLHSSE
jgi:phage gp46-like protein